jgi:hypothetical protein
MRKNPSRRTALIADSSSVALLKRLRRHRLVFTLQSFSYAYCYDECSWGHKMPAAPLRVWLAMLTRQLYNLLTSETPLHSTLVPETLSSIVSLTSIVDTDMDCDHYQQSMMCPYSDALQARAGFIVSQQTDKGFFKLSLKVQFLCYHLSRTGDLSSRTFPYIAKFMARRRI